MIRKAAKSSKGVMHWTRQSNEMNNQNSSKWDVFLFAFTGPLLAIIGHYWSLLSNYYRIVYAQMFCRTFTILSILKIAVGLSWHWCRFRQFVAIVCRSSPVRGSHVAGSRPCRLSEFTPNRASYHCEQASRWRGAERVAWGENHHYHKIKIEIKKKHVLLLGRKIYSKGSL